METLTHTQLKDMILNEITGVAFVSIRSITKQNSLNKGGTMGKPSLFESLNINPDTIKKHSNSVGLISGGAVSYQDFVNNRLNKEAKDAGKPKAQLTFEAGPRKWGTKVNGTNALVEHKGANYLVVYCLANNKPIVEHRYNSQILDLNESRFDTWRKPEKNEGDNQGADNPIIVRDYKFESIKEITINKTTYKVIPDSDN